jgi:hypothetical protein
MVDNQRRGCRVEVFVIGSQQINSYLNLTKDWDPFPSPTEVPKQKPDLE